MKGGCLTPWQLQNHNFELAEHPSCLIVQRDDDGYMTPVHLQTYRYDWELNLYEGILAAYVEAFVRSLPVETACKTSTFYWYSRYRGLNKGVNGHDVTDPHFLNVVSRFT
jgi:hypothetical protein